MMLSEDPRVSDKHFLGAFAPFPRSSWIHPHAPYDHYDLVCINIWRKAKESKEQLARGQSSPERQQNKGCRAADYQPSHRAEEQQKETDDLGLSTPCKEDKQQYPCAFTLPCPYPLGRRHPHVTKPARVLNPVMEGEMRRNADGEMGKRNLEKDAGDKQRRVRNSLKKICVPQSSSIRDKQSFAPEPQPLATNPLCFATEDEENPPLLSELPRDTCESEDERNISSSTDYNSSDDNDCVALPGMRSCGTDSSDGDSGSENNDCVKVENEIPHSSDQLSSDSELDSPSSSTNNDFPPLSTIKAGIRPCPTEPPASGKMHSQWEIPLSFHPHDIPTATLARAVTTLAQAPVQGKAEAPQANSKNAPPAAPTQQEAYDLLADFPALQPPKKPLALGALRDGKTKGAEGKRRLTRSQNQRQESGASHQRRMENVPHEVSPICAGDQKSVLDLQTFGSTGQRNSPTISCEELKANNQPSPRVAGTDGVDVNAKSWASAAKAGMKQAAAPQEKARPCTFQQIVTINRAKARCSATANVPNKVTPSNRAAAPVYHGPRPRNQNRCVRPGNTPAHQHFGAQAYRANCPPGFRCPRFPFQQGRGQPRHNQV